MRRGRNEKRNMMGKTEGKVADGVRLLEEGKPDNIGDD